MSNRPCWIFYGTNDQNVKFVKDQVVPALSLDVKCWIGGLPDLRSIVRKYFPETTYYSQDASNALIDKDIEHNPDFPEMCSPEFLLNLDNIYRRFKFDFNHAIQFDEQNHCVNVARSYFNRLSKEKIEIAIFFEYPHSIGSYIAYLVCKHLKIKVIIRTISPFEDRVFYTSDISEGIPSYYNKLNDDDQTAFKQILLKVNRSYSEAQPSYMKKQTKRLFLVSKIRRFSTYFKQLQWKNFYRAIVADRIDLKANKFVYVGLHYQPELTSFPLGGIYNNQHLMVLFLSAVIPPDWKIIVKEHPTTFRYVKKNMTLFRSKYFYTSFRNIPKVEFSDYAFDSFELIDNAACIATLTGTLGYEGVLRGKPCLTFGDAPYLGCEGVFRVTDFQSLKNIWDELMKRNFTVNKEQVLAYTERALANTLYSRTSTDFDKFDEERQLDYLVKVFNG